MSLEVKDSERKSIIKVILWVFPSIIAVCTWLIMDKLNTILDAIKLVPGINTTLALHEAHLTRLDADYSTFHGDYKELEKLVGTKEDKIELPKKENQ